MHFYFSFPPLHARSHFPPQNKVIITWQMHVTIGSEHGLLQVTIFSLPIAQILDDTLLYSCMALHINTSPTEMSGSFILLMHCWELDQQWQLFRFIQTCFSYQSILSIKILLMAEFYELYAGDTRLKMSANLRWLLLCLVSSVVAYVQGSWKYLYDIAALYNISGWQPHFFYWCSESVGTFAGGVLGTFFPLPMISLLLGEAITALVCCIKSVTIIKH